ncbi:MAG: UDP-N-acetylmuramoyl-L-alanine--D-glutamate ligase [Thermomicrobiales bacterium]|nr:UDP-N-acetylmuramoyl-L-alanine--D-glutamate ligase [Thermomicrobiales bacterium]
MSNDLAGVRFTVLGLGILGGGVGVAKYLASHGGIVTVTDMRPADQLQSSIDQLAGLPITYHLGGHIDADFTSENADIVIRNPGVRRWSPYLKLARESGVRIDMEMSLFFPRCAAPILGITGTKGKTTVSTLTGDIMRAWRPNAILAGNMGVSALGVVDDIQPDQLVVIELSSWQLEALAEHKLGPHVAVITNISPDHLDAYDGFEDYAATKRSIAHHLGAGDYLVYNADDPDTAKVVHETGAHLLPFQMTEPGGDGAWADEALHFRLNGVTLDLPLPTQLSLSGEQGLRNALAAGLASLAYGAPASAVATGIAGFKGVENRMEEIVTIAGVMYVNDTSATAPAAAVHAIDVLSQKAQVVHIIAGGADKETDLTPFADAIASHKVSVYLLDGTATTILMQLLDDRGVFYEGPYHSMAEVVDAAASRAEAGDAIALVPGCASFGMFRNEFDRGNQFKDAVKHIQESQGDN